MIQDMRLLDLVAYNLIRRHNKACHLHQAPRKLLLGLYCVEVTDDDLRSPTYRLQHVNLGGVAVAISFRSI